MPTEPNLQGSILHWLNSIYGDSDTISLRVTASRILTRLEQRSAKKSFLVKSERSQYWGEETCILISYADSIKDNKKAPILCLNEFINDHLDKVIDSVHILPFFPSTSDDGFSVLDYKVVDPRLGSWKDIEALSLSRNVMADIVLNHGSRSSRLFKQFVDNEAPGKDFFISVDDDFDISNVVRPREHPLLQKQETAIGTQNVWCTFSQDQVDFNFSNPDVLEEFIYIILNLIDHGIKILRLDAVGFIWKKAGTSCLNLPQTHKIIKLIRHIANHYNNDVLVVTETNLPNQENLSYFGNGNEAHCIYNFSLPPLIIHSLLFSDASTLRRWSMSMPPALEGTTYLNFLSSHDGFGMRPTEGILNDTQRDALLNRLEKNGSLFSWRIKTDGTNGVYEANATLFSALKTSEEDTDGAFQRQRFIAAYTLIFALEGIPAIYLNSFIGAENDKKGVEASGLKRRINRQKFDKHWLYTQLNNPESREAFSLETLKSLLYIRAKQAAFHPNATQFTLQLSNDFFGVWRQSRDRRQSIFAITNLCASNKILVLSEINLIETESWVDLILNQKVDTEKAHLTLCPYQTVWISNIVI